MSVSNSDFMREYASSIDSSLSESFVIAGTYVISRFVSTWPFILGSTPRSSIIYRSSLIYDVY